MQDRSTRIPNARATPPNANIWTPALSSNYLHIRVAGKFPPNQMLSVSTVTIPGAHYLNARTETATAFAV
jgi:hypothetical protein